MGAIHFSLDLNLVTALRTQLPLKVFVETGTFRGDTTAAVANSFPEIHTVEFSRAIFDQTAERLRGLANVNMIFGSSPDALLQMREKLKSESVLYWLDAHWCGGSTSGEQYECPLLAELSAIAALNEKSVILVDDARFFIAPPPEPHSVSGWPMLGEVIDGLRALSSKHKLWIINDVIIFAPIQAEPDVNEYGRKHGVDLHQLHELATQAAEAVRTRDEKAVELEASRAGQLPFRLDGGLAGRGRFNEAFASSERSERIFAFHLARMGVSSVLDVGANAGQFALRLRGLGYDGDIYSVEPQTAAYSLLLDSASKDLRWIPLVRGAAGGAAGWAELNLSQNGWSSSILEVHPNHVAAENTTRIVGTETIRIAKTAELMRPELMGQIEALKIDVQGFEKAVLEGCGPILRSVRLLLVEMSLVECYRGAETLFSLDGYLTDEMGFSRVSLEPAYYDDGLGVVQQYDGIYYRPDPSKEKAKLHLRPAGKPVVVTSIGGEISRSRFDGVEVGPAWRNDCIASLKSTADQVISVSENSPNTAGITWKKTIARPAVGEMLRQVESEITGSVVLTNSDIVLTDAFRAALSQMNPDVIYYGRRHEVGHDRNDVERMLAMTIYNWGFDYFVLPPTFVRLVNSEAWLPDNYLIGEPWWDYLVPLLGAGLGFPIKKLGARTVYAGHYSHPERFSQELWLENGQEFLEVVSRLQKAELPYSQGLIADLLRPEVNWRDQLERVSQTMCFAIP